MKTPTEIMAPDLKSKTPPSVIELTTYESICTKTNAQKKVQKYRTYLSPLPYLSSLIILPYAFQIINAKIDIHPFA
jgi:hypothetical protein